MLSQPRSGKVLRVLEVLRRRRRSDRCPRSPTRTAGGLVPSFSSGQCCSFRTRHAIPPDRPVDCPPDRTTTNRTLLHPIIFNGAASAPRPPSDLFVGLPVRPAPPSPDSCHDPAPSSRPPAGSRPTPSSRLVERPATPAPTNTVHAPGSSGHQRPVGPRTWHGGSLLAYRLSSTPGWRGFRREERSEAEWSKHCRVLSSIVGALAENCEYCRRRRARAKREAM